MALVKCKECGKEVSTKAGKCPHCGITEPGKKFSLSSWQIIVGISIILAWIGSSGREKTVPKENYPTVYETYESVDLQVGCNSKYGDTKKDDIFNSKYKDKWIQWSGTIVQADADRISIDIDGVGTQDLSVELSNSKAGYNLQKGQYITLKFLMKSAGGCFLPFSGEKGVIIQ